MRATIYLFLQMLTDNKHPRIIQIGDGQLLLLSAQPVDLDSDGLLSTTDAGNDQEFDVGNDDEEEGELNAAQFIAALDSSAFENAQLDSETLLSDANGYEMPAVVSSGRSRPRRQAKRKRNAEDAELAEEPLYVNAKQFERILARRRARARLEARGIFVKERPKYLHESRHRHAANRRRGPGGQFDNLQKAEETPPGDQT